LIHSPDTLAGQCGCPETSLLKAPPKFSALWAKLCAHCRAVDVPQRHYKGPRHANRGVLYSYDREGRIHADNYRRHVCATLGNASQSRRVNTTWFPYPQNYFPNYLLCCVILRSDFEVVRLLEEISSCCPAPCLIDSIKCPRARSKRIADDWPTCSLRICGAATLGE